MALIDPEILFKKLIDLRKKLNINLHSKEYSIEVDPISKIELQLESDDGITVSENDIDKILGGSLLAYKGNLAIVYISDTQKTEEYLKNDNLLRSGKGGKEEEKGPKFHFSWCRTLEQMKNRGRYDRYVLLRNKNNKFKVQAKEDRHSEAYFIDELVRLFSCKNCLEGFLAFSDEKSGYKGYEKSWSKEDKHDAVRDFNIGDFLSENEGTFNTIKHAVKYTDQNVPTNKYSSSFTEISRNLRESSGWICSKCNVNMSNMKEGLHTHHANGVKNDNSSRNLKVLCALCHKGIDSSHSNMHVKKSIENYILSNR